MKKKKSEKPFNSAPGEITSSLKNNKNYPLWQVATALAVLGGIIYSNSFDCSFHYDDISSIVDNKQIRNLDELGNLWLYYRSRFFAHLSFALNYHFGGQNVWGYHFVNLLIHLTNAILVYTFTQLVFETPVIREQEIANKRHFIALFSAFIFISHPLATQSVTYIVQRMASLVTLFYLLSVASYLKARLIQENSMKKIVLFVLSGVAMFMAFFTKENGYSLPISIALVELLLLNNRIVISKSLFKRLLLFLLICTGLMCYLLNTYSLAILKPIPPSIFSNFVAITSKSYLYTQFFVVLKYLQLLFLPLYQNVDYDVALSENFADIRTVLSFLGILMLFTLSLFWYKKHRLLSFSVFWFFSTVLIESSFIPISDVINEHRTYLPSVGFCLFLPSALFIIDRHLKLYLAIPLLLFTIFFFSVLTYNRNKVWQNELTLWSDTQQKSPNKVRPLNYLGTEYLDEGNSEKAIACWSKAIEIQPNFKILYFNRGVAFKTQKKWQEAIKDFSTVISIDSSEARSYFFRGEMYSNVKDMENALNDFKRVVYIDPNYKNGWYNLGVCYASLLKWDDAIVAFEQSIARDSTFVSSYINKGVCLERMGKWQPALENYEKALKIDPTNINAIKNRDLLKNTISKQNGN